MDAKSITIFVGMLLAVPTPTWAGCEISLSDETAKQTIDAQWNSAYSRIRLGTFKLSFDRVIDSDIKKVDSPQIRSIRAAAAAGLVDGFLRDNHDGSTHSIIEWVWPGQYTLVVNETALGRELSRRTGLEQSEEFLYLYNGTSSVVDVVANEERTSGADIYRVVKARYRVESLPEAYIAWRQSLRKIIEDGWQQPADWLKGSYSADRKAIVLLKLDQFACKWTIVEEDTADVSEEFHSNYVNDALGKLGVTGTD